MHVEKVFISIPGDLCALMRTLNTFNSTSADNMFLLFIAHFRSVNEFGLDRERFL